MNDYTPITFEDAHDKARRIIDILDGYDVRDVLLITSQVDLAIIRQITFLEDRKKLVVAMKELLDKAYVFSLTMKTLEEIK